MSDQLVDESQLITGSCKDCPPGYIWKCCKDDGGYPLGPPVVVECLNQDFILSNVQCDTPYGILNSFKYKATLFKADGTIVWEYNESGISSGQTTAVCYSDELKYAFFVGYLYNDNTDIYNKDRIVINILNIEDGSLVKRITLPKDNLWGGVNPDVDSIGYSNGALYIAGSFAYRNDFARMGYAQVNIFTGEFTKFYGVHQINIDAGNFNSIAIKEGSNIMYIGITRWRLSSSGSYNDYNGKLYRHDVTTTEVVGDQTLIAEGTTDPSAYDHIELYGSRLNIVGDKLLVASQNDGGSNGYITAYTNADYNHAYSFDVYDYYTGNFIKTVYSQSPNEYKPYWNCFGYKFSSCGNFILTSDMYMRREPANGTSDRYGHGCGVLMDKNFNIIRYIDSNPLAKNNDVLGHVIGIDSEYILVGNAAGVFGSGNTQAIICKYENAF